MIEPIVEEGTRWMRESFGFVPEHSRLTVYDEHLWDAFTAANRFEREANGLYLPAALHAYVKHDAMIEPTIYHELFGHGSYHEHSIDGLVEDGPIDVYEGYALFVESLMSDALGANRTWNTQEAELLERFTAAAHALTRIGLFGELGLPKHYRADDVRRIVDRFYDASRLDLVVLYGSRKPTSDIDLFIVGDVPPIHTTWLDTYVVDRERFASWLERFDVSVTDPIMSGEAIIGEIDGFRRQLEEQPINHLAIDHHEQEIRRLEALEERGVLGSHLRGRNRVYALQRAGWRYLLLAEHYKTLSFLEKHPHIEQLLNTTVIEGIGIIYGSYAKGTETRTSDLDLFIAGTGEIPKNTGIHTTTYPLEAFEQKISTDAYLREVIEHRVVISGAEALVRMIRDTRA
ncbi:MAG: nucleotidyltransferase domain-containing protein [Candidatus Woesearchaeota archaeon]